MWVRLNHTLRSSKSLQLGCQKFASSYLKGQEISSLRNVSLPATHFNWTARSYCTENDRSTSNISLPPLMNNVPKLIWPEFLKTLRNFFFVNFYIRPRYDREFDLDEFGEGSKQALEIISNKLSQGQYDDLADLVHPAALEEVKRNMSSFTVAQRELVSVNKDDIFFAFPYEIGIIEPNSDGQKFDYIEGRPEPPTRLVEIMVVFHVLRGISAEREQLTQKPMREFMQDDSLKQRIMICTYRFVRDFTEGKEPVWMVNLLNQYLPNER